MLAFQHIPSSSPTHNYTPLHPSPLSPRSANIYGHHPRVQMSNTTNAPSKAIAESQQENQPQNQMFRFGATTPEPRSTNVPFSKRPIKRPPPQRTDDLKEKRRNNFLRRVSDQREERRYETRGEDIMRLDFMQRQKAWEAEREREASSQNQVEVDEEYELPGWSSSQQMLDAPEEEEVEDFVKDEEAELQAMLEFMPQQQQQEETPGMWSDDAVDYDELFEEVLSQQQMQEVQHDDEMDMS